MKNEYFFSKDLQYIDWIKKTFYDLDFYNTKYRDEFITTLIDLYKKIQNTYYYNGGNVRIFRSELLGYISDIMIENDVTYFEKFKKFLNKEDKIKYEHLFNANNFNLF